MSKRILMIAYHFPPVRGSSGVLRTLHFARHLAHDHGWKPTVLTVAPRAYASTSDDQLGDIAPEVEVIRAFALDTSRHLSIAGRYPRALALPDRWMSWKPFGIRAGLKAHRRTPFDVIWSTYPIATAHTIGNALARRLKIPWIADFRDSMTEEDFPPEPMQRAAFRAIEASAVADCRRAVFTTPGTRSMYAARYPEIPDDRWAVISNGFDERSFRDAEKQAQPSATRPLRLVHSGLLYRWERDPRPFFQAVARLRREGVVDSTRLQISLRASGDEEYHREHIEKEQISDIVKLDSALPYREALADMLTADGLLLFQASNCNHQIPAKAYEYLRARRPIFALTDPIGDTAGVLRESGAATIAPLDDADAIARALRDFLPTIEEGRHPLASDAFIEAQSRRARTGALAELLENLQA